MKRFSLLSVGALTGLVAALAPTAVLADDYDKKTVVTINTETEIPGMVLPPGTYVIKLLNSSSNRHIAEIMNERMDHLYALSFVAAAERVYPTDKTVITFYEGGNGRPPALRKWFWPSDNIGQEFIYPKDQAAKIAAATGQKVPEGNLPTVAESGQSLKPDNANELTVQVSKNEVKKDRDDEVKKDRDDDDDKNVAVTARAAEPEVIAQNTPPPPPPARVTEIEPAPVVSVESTPRPSESVTTASNDTAEKTLPQTASNLPLIALLGSLSLAGALLVTSIRRSSSQKL